MEWIGDRAWSRAIDPAGDERVRHPMGLYKPLDIARPYRAVTAMPGGDDDPVDVFDACVLAANPPEVRAIVRNILIERDQQRSATAIACADVEGPADHLAQRRGIKQPGLCFVLSIGLEYLRFDNACLTRHRQRLPASIAVPERNAAPAGSAGRPFRISRPSLKRDPERSLHVTRAAHRRVSKALRRIARTVLSAAIAGSAPVLGKTGVIVPMTGAFSFVEIELERSERQNRPGEFAKSGLETA